MASDVIFDNLKGFEDLDSNIDVGFMNDGVMDPKELYLTDLACTKDASSSDSGISTQDELPDIANDTDLQSLIDADFKDLDFSFDQALSKGDHGGFDSDLFLNLEGVKAEPLSPRTPLISDSGSDDMCFADTMSPDFYTVYDDATLNNDSIPVILPVKCESSEQQPIYYQEILDPQQQQSPAYSPQSLSSPSSPLNSLVSPTILTAQPQVTLSPQDIASHHVTTKPSSLNFTVLPSTSQPSILVLPQVKKEILTVTPSPPSQQAISTIPITKPAAAVDLSTILNSKIKIKPKPGLEKVVSIANASQRVPLAASQVPLSSQAISMRNLVTSNSLLPTGIASLADAKSLKRAQRIIKNRESASLSRKRKKEYMSSLEERLQACVDENSRLIRENEALKKQVDSLKVENLQLKVPNGVSPAKKMCLMCFALLLMLNLAPYSFVSVPTSGTDSSTANLPHHYVGRQLLSMPSNGTSEEGSKSKAMPWIDRDSLSRLNEELSQVVNKLNISGKVADMCPMYFNSTESLRLAEQLTGWMIRQEEEKKKKEQKKRQKRKKTYPTLRRFGSSAYMNADSEPPRSGRHLHGILGHNYPVQVFSGPDPRQQMLNAIHRRNDTFYILSFSTDYFLVPASAHNKTMRPRMSLLMPVFTPTLNESTGQSQDSVAMMQIDCEIHNTNLIYIQRSALPKDATLNSTTTEEHFQGYKNTEEKARGSDNGNSTSGGGRGMRQGGMYWENLRQKKAFT